MIAIFYLVLQILKLYSYVVVANVIVSWLISFNVLNTQNRFVYALLELSYRLTEPFLSKAASFLPSIKIIMFLEYHWCNVELHTHFYKPNQ